MEAMGHLVLFRSTLTRLYAQERDKYVKPAGGPNPGEQRFRKVILSLHQGRQLPFGDLQNVNASAKLSVPVGNGLRLSWNGMVIVPPPRVTMVAENTLHVS